jgi:hypothetical protein
MTQMVSELYDALRSVGVADDTAKSAARAVIAAEEKDRLATKADINELHLATKADINELRLATKADISELRLATKADISELRLATKADIAELKSEMTWRIVLVMSVVMSIQTAVFSAIVTAAFKFLRP